MVLCPPFRWRSKGGFTLNTDSAPQRKATISKLNPDDFVVPNGKNDLPSESASPSRKDTGLSVNMSGADSKKSSHMSCQSAQSGVSKESEEATYSRKSSIEAPPVISAVSDYLQVDVDADTHRKRPRVYAPPINADSARSSADLTYPKYEKDGQSQDQIRKAVLANDFLRNLMDQDRLAAVVDAMSPQQYTAGNLIVREGETGSHLFVSALGQFEVLKNGQVVKTFGPGEAFGELAILYKAKRFASIRCITEAKVWMLERRVFQKIMVRSGRQEQEDNVRFLASVPLLRDIHPIELAKISEFLKREFFSAGTVIVRQGDRGDKFYIIRGGTVSVTKRDADGGSERRVATLRRGDYFGEQALMYEDCRLATVTAQPPGVECLTLQRGPFTKLLGNLEELRKIRHDPPRPSDPKKKTSQIKSEFEFVELADLEIVGTMGVGGFGRVELVQSRRDRSLTFALKCLKKVDMVQQQQQEHAFSEKKIMLACNSPFVCRLYRTFKDRKYIYFLMEPVLGGDVWTLLQRARFFPDATARFIVACVLEAFQYLHERNIVYRDLKPENLMLDERGFVKLVDFGFAKELASNHKTWTFAGTPEYVAPEIVLNKGHDRAVDCWALGVFIHELLVGKPPFRAPGGDHMKTYSLIIRGIDAVVFHPRVSKSAQMLIRKLCRPVPAERLGYLKNGIPDVKNHKWFLGFDWDALKKRQMRPPLIPKVAGPTDLSNFDNYPKDKMPPDENSGWDLDF